MQVKRFIFADDAKFAMKLCCNCEVVCKIVKGAIQLLPVLMVDWLVQKND
ncbi:hypothetical protein TDB9533_03972 [Thalassocella blandensis]|nr:hypothetical protein TDB9533_03972 [Thalassocella blandensis]